MGAFQDGYLSRDQVFIVSEKISFGTFGSFRDLFVDSLFQLGCFRIHNHTVVHVRRTECANLCSNICDLVCARTNKTMEEVLQQLLEIKHTRCTFYFLLVW